MKIVIIGTRGIPARYGGFETFAEELSTRLVRRGHNLTVYCRKYLYPENVSSYKGVRCVHLPCVRVKSLETLSHTFLSLAHALKDEADVIVMCNVANSPLCVVPRFFKKLVALNCDGLEWKRAKWGRTGRWYLKQAEKLASKYCDAVVADNGCIADYYKREYGIDAVFIPYGATIAQPQGTGALERFGLEKDRYFLTVTRLEPENNTDLILRAYKRVETDMPLVIVGSVPYKSTYYQRLQGFAGPQVKFVGAVYDKNILGQVWSNCFAYLHGNEVGGTNPALLQAMAYGNCVIALDVCFNREVVEKSAILYEKDEEALTLQIRRVVDDETLRRKLKKKAVKRISRHYTWESVVDAYERLCYALLHRQTVLKE